MIKQTRRKFSAEFKAKVALEAIKNQKTLAQLSQPILPPEKTPGNQDETGRSL